jgi:hypothetical protein
MAMWWTWVRIACHELGEASRARQDSATQWKYETESSASLSTEFERSVTSISAVAFALEALSKELEEAGHILNTSSIRPGRKVSAGYYVGHSIVAAFGLDGTFAQSLPSSLDKLFVLRNDAVHFESPWRLGTHPHPSGTHTAYEITIYTMEEALKWVNLIHDLFIQIEQAVDSKRRDSAASHIANEISGVHAMFDEVIRIERIKLTSVCSDG